MHVVNALLMIIVLNANILHIVQLQINVLNVLHSVMVLVNWLIILILYVLMDVQMDTLKKMEIVFNVKNPVELVKIMNQIVVLVLLVIIIIKLFIVIIVIFVI